VCLIMVISLPKKEPKKASLMIFFCKISSFFLPTRRLARSLKTATSCFFYALPHPDRLFPTLFPAARLFGLLRQPMLIK
ncbi:MAG: hypothetical protein ACYC01_13400, partial [Lutibacter sp.]